MAKHEHTLEVTKEEGSCFACPNTGKTTCISTGTNKYDTVAIFLCNRCLNWLKGKLQGF